MSQTRDTLNQEEQQAIQTIEEFNILFKKRDHLTELIKLEYKLQPELDHVNLIINNTIEALRAQGKVL